jgi:hypothetical protein
MMLPSDQTVVQSASVCSDSCAHPIDCNHDSCESFLNPIGFAKRPIRNRLTCPAGTTTALNACDNLFEGRPVKKMPCLNHAWRGAVGAAAQVKGGKALGHSRRRSSPGSSFATCDRTQAKSHDAMRGPPMQSAMVPPKMVLDEKSPSDPAIGLASLGWGSNGSFAILRRTGCCFGLNPKTNAQIRRSDELNSGVLERLTNLLDGVEVGLDTTFRAFQPADGGKRQPGQPGKLILSPSEKRACCLNLSRVNEHLCL